MKVKTKIFLESGLIALLVIFVSIWGQILIFQLAEDAKKIAVENYRSIEYTKELLKALDGAQSYHERQYLHSAGDFSEDLGRTAEYQNFLDNFDKNLRLEEANITEPGEYEVVKGLRVAFSDYQTLVQTIRQFSRYDAVTFYTDLKPKMDQIRKFVYSIEEINLAASNLKSELPRQFANPMFSWMQILGNLSIVLALFLLFFIRIQLKKLE